MTTVDGSNQQQPEAAPAAIPEGAVSGATIHTTLLGGGEPTPGGGPKRWPMVIAIILGLAAGVVLSLFALMDWTSSANLAFAGCLILAHVCVGILLGFIVNGIRARRPSDDDPTPGTPQAPLRVVRWIIVALLVGWAVWLLDNFVLGLSDNPGPRTALAVLAGVGVLAGLAWEVTAFQLMPGRRDKATRYVLAGVASLPVGALVVLVAVDRRSDQRQASIEPADEHQLPVIPLQPDHPVYVALGDSYSAGEGIEPFINGTAADCHRSPFAYPRMLRFASDDPATHADDLHNLEFRACSGAVTADIDLGVPGGVPAQIDPRPRGDVGLVTVTVGGNDVVFSTIVRECILFDECASRTFDAPDADPQYPDIQYPPSGRFDEWANTALGPDYLASRIDRVYHDLRTTYPEARILVVGYPYLFPAGDPPSVWDLNDCASLLRRVDGSERKALRTKVDQLNAMLADQAYAAGIEFVSPQAAWDGHEPCGRAAQWTNAIRLDLKRATSMRVLNGSSFHPNRRGQLELARIVSCYVTTNPEPLTTAPSTGVPGTMANPVVVGEQCAGPSSAG